VVVGSVRGWAGHLGSKQPNRYRLFAAPESVAGPGREGGGDIVYTVELYGGEVGEVFGL
jgi:hypothetical protein